MSEFQALENDGSTPDSRQPAVKKTEETGTLDTAESRARSKFAKRAGLPGSVGKWFEENPEALQEVTIWMEMVKAGETEWSMARLFREIVSEHAYPFSGPTNFGAFMRNCFPKQYPHHPNKNTTVR